MTTLLQVDPTAPKISELGPAIELLKQGQVVAFPTETVYGLGANALDPEAVAKIFAAKNRPSDNPLIVHISSLEMLSSLAEGSFLRDQQTLLQKIFSMFWPGPLTILFPRSQLVPDIVTAGLDKVAVRMPSHPVALALISGANLPIAAPSANLSGRPSPTRAKHVYQDLNGRIPCIVDGGSAKVGLESTVIDFTNRSQPLVLRPGGVTLESLKQVIPEIEHYGKKHDPNLQERPSTPGLKYTHYSPKAPVVLFEILPSGFPTLSQRVLEYLKNSSLAPHSKIGVILTESPYELPPQDRYELLPVFIGGNEKTADLEMVAHELFNSLRELDEQKCQLILVQAVVEHQQGVAIMNRLRKAASFLVKETSS